MLIHFFRFFNSRIKYLLKFRDHRVSEFGLVEIN